MSTEDDFASFVHGTGAQLYRAALLLTGDHHQAEDLTQATFAKVFVSWRRVRRADNPVAYTRTILMNTFLSSKRLRRSSELTIDVGPDDVPVPGIDPDARLDLLDALAALRPDDRLVLVARYWEDRSVAETAHLLGISETAVRTRARRALARIRPHFTDTVTEGTPS
ncbi:hypothetical protein ASG90_07885 [Nocardioides sp. Soil797]|nr:hypothetical protein ASG90_07885 [Nocardioides sp. Soil797]